jgi:hypothetical protein
VAVTTNTWLGATAGSLPAAAQQAAFLGVHKVQMLYAATLKASQTGNGAAHSSGNATTYWAQSFATAVGQTTIGYVIVPITSTTSSGSTLGPTTLSLYANSGSAPTGSPLVSSAITTEYAQQASGGVDTAQVIYPLPITGLSASTTYWLVLAPAGNATFHFNWRQSNQVSGASSSTNGTTWTAQGFGLQYQIYDQTASGTLTAIWEDAGARWQALTYNAALNAVTLAQYTAGQGSGYVQGYRTLSYSNSLLTKVV